MIPIDAELHGESEFQGPGVTKNYATGVPHMSVFIFVPQRACEWALNLFSLSWAERGPAYGPARARGAQAQRGRTRASARFRVRGRDGRVR